MNVLTRRDVDAESVGQVGRRSGISATDFFLELPGIPVPKARARTTKSGYSYTPSKTKAYEDDIRLFGRQAMRGRKPWEGAIRLEVVAYLPVPKSWPKWKKAHVTDHGVFISHTVKPDWDNLAKVIDGLTGVVWKDDSQICDATVRKRYSNQPRLVIQAVLMDSLNSHSPKPS